MINGIPEEERVAILKKYEQYDLSKSDIKFTYLTIMKKRVPMILEQYHYYEFM